MSMKPKTPVECMAKRQLYLTRLFLCTLSLSRCDSRRGRGFGGFGAGAAGVPSGAAGGASAMGSPSIEFCSTLSPKAGKGRCLLYQKTCCLTAHQVRSARSARIPPLLNTFDRKLLTPLQTVQVHSTRQEGRSRSFGVPQNCTTFTRCCPSMSTVAHHFCRTGVPCDESEIHLEAWLLTKKSFHTRTGRLALCLQPVKFIFIQDSSEFIASKCTCEMNNSDPATTEASNRMGFTFIPSQETFDKGLYGYCIATTHFALGRDGKLMQPTGDCVSDATTFN
ncbi:hypothetical protein MPTK1_1g26220 [Marchantia polymorpha subsp. ruderalis]|uniref:Uncharacterized protein n=1 Tax=Marchantia polymorpha subsp. ruderalis TaxID=1480154 RepID=A0AAF6AUF8_MARPO|nr:hypothetical protein Mp_1g26220 [Marchantia polymorpha subsp. ruderalis]